MKMRKRTFKVHIHTPSSPSASPLHDFDDTDTGPSSVTPPLPWLTLPHLQQYILLLLLLLRSRKLKRWNHWQELREGW
jgi:hypothetical protein